MLGGLAVYDNSYIDITGCWAASSVTDNIWTHPSSNPQLVIVGGTIFNAGAYGGGDCAKSDCNGVTLNGGSLTMTGVSVRNNQVRCFESLSKFLWLTALTPLNLEAHRPQNIPKRSFRYRHCCASDQRFHDHLVLRVPEQNVHSIGPAEPSRQQPVQVNTLRIQAKALHSITIFTSGCRTLRCRWHSMCGALTFFRCCFMDSCQVLHASCGGHNALILKPTQHETCRLNPGQQHPT